MMSQRVCLGAGIGVALFVVGWWVGGSIPRGAVPGAVGAEADRADPAASAAAAAADPGHTLAAVLEQRVVGQRSLSRRDLRALVTHADPAEMADLLATVAQIPGRTDREWIRGALLERWAGAEPLAALQWASAVANGSERSSALTTVFTVWAEHDPATAAQQALQVNGQWTRRSSIGAVATAWAAADPEAAKAWAAGLPSGSLRKAALENVTTELARTDPNSALAYALSAPSGQTRDSAIAIVVHRMAQLDPEAAMAAVGQLPAGNAREQASRNIVSALADTDPILAGDYVLTLPAGATRNQAVKTVARSLAQQDVKAAIDWVTSAAPAGEGRASALREVFNYAAQTAPVEASQHLNLLTGEARQMATVQVAAMWAISDLPAATAWVRQLPAGADRNDAAGRVVAMLFATDPANALATAQRDFTDVPPQSLFRELGYFAAQRDALAALALLEQVPAGPGREAFAQSLARGLARSQPQEAIKLLDRLPDGRAREQTAANIASAWSMSDPRAAATWAAALPDERSRERVMTSVVSSWVRNDPPSAWQWANSQPAGTTRDSIMSNAATNLAYNDDPASAVQWVAAIADAQRRRNAINNVAGQWLRRDREAATAWLATTDLTEEQKQQLLKDPTP